MDFLGKHKVKIAIGAGISVVVGFITYLATKGDEVEEGQKKGQEGKKEGAATETAAASANNKPREEKVKKAGVAPTQSTDEYQVPNIEPKSAKEVASKIEVKFNNETNTLDFKTIVMIVEQSIELAKLDYIKLTYDNRKRRRAVKTRNQEEYEQMILDYNEEVENLITKACDELLIELNLTKEVFEDSMVTLMERGFYQQIFMLQAAIRQKIKEYLPIKQDIPPSKTKEIIRYQVKMLENEPERFRSIVQKLQGNVETIQMIPLVINTILADMIFDEFHLEEEDQMKNMMGPEIMKDPEIHELLRGTEQAMMKLLGAGGPGMGMMGGGGFF